MTRTDALTSCSRHEGITGRKVEFELNGKTVTRTTRQDFIWRNMKANTEVGPEYVIVNGEKVAVDSIDGLRWI